MSQGINPMKVSGEMRSTATLTNLMQSIKSNAVNTNMPQKQAKKYHIDLGQNVSRILYFSLFELKKAVITLSLLFSLDPLKQKILMELHLSTCSVPRAIMSRNKTQRLDNLR